MMPERNKFSPQPDLPLGKYRHYKGGEYEVLALACDEATHEWKVVYKALYNTGDAPQVWIRSYTNFVEALEAEGYGLVSRFEKEIVDTTPLTIDSLVRLSDLLSKCQDIKRGIKLPHGEDESDSHHAFSLAIASYDICSKLELEIDMEKILAYALVHDLLEIVTGDEVTLTMSEKELEEKHGREQNAQIEFRSLLQEYPDILALHDEYERLDTPEAATVFVLDKACTTWTHFHDNGDNLRSYGIADSAALETWYHATKAKFAKRLRAHAPSAIYDIFERSYETLRDTVLAP